MSRRIIPKSTSRQTHRRDERGPVLGNSHADELMWRVLESTHEVVQLVDCEGRVLYRKNGKHEVSPDNELPPWIQFWDAQWQAAAEGAFAQAQAGQAARFEAS